MAERERERETERADKIGERADQFGERAETIGERADNFGERDVSTSPPSSVVTTPSYWLVLHHLLNISLRTTTMKSRFISTPEAMWWLYNAITPLPVLPGSGGKAAH